MTMLLLLLMLDAAVLVEIDFEMRVERHGSFGTFPVQKGTQMEKEA
jgi:hypothetical protein